MKQIRTFSFGELHIEYYDSVNYVDLLNGVSVIDSIKILNTEKEELTNLKIQIDGFYFPKSETSSFSIAGESVKNVTLNVNPSVDKLRSLTEAVFTEFVLTVLYSDKPVAEFRFPITLQAWNHWSGNGLRLESLVSFVMPNHPYVAALTEKVAERLRKISPSMFIKGYFVENPDEVMSQLKILWEVICMEHINYIRTTNNFIDEGQRIVTPEQLSHTRQGCCLDMTLLFCSCLERMGFESIMLGVPGHIMPGVWLKSNETKEDVVCTSAADIRDYFGQENNVIVFESTLACANNDFISFEEAIDNTTPYFESDENLEYLIDVKNSRFFGKVRTIPFDASIMGIQAEEYGIRGQAGMIADSSRLKGWERKLLDLSLRNSMLNLKPTKTMVPLSENNISSIYTRLKSNTLSEIIGPLGKDNTELLKSLYRGARTSIEENGANSLFVAIGTLRWFDVDDPRQHHAPMIFIPVSMVRKKAMTYEVRLRDDEPMINVTLIEMLRQMFGVTFPDLSSLPELESGLPDWQRIFIMFKEQIEEINKHSAPEKEWKLLDDSHIGIFSFTKFLMWHNVHFHPEVIEQHRILRGFINNQYNSEEDIPQAKVRDIEGSSPLDLMLPINYDSSQLEAVAECSSGRSFVLHGPPGTGKSQTITNMIANSIYQGKRVLFVAEKNAALEVVRARLNAIGLEPYCLELHSNKTDKRSFFSQVAGSKINQIGSKRPTPPFPTNYKEKAPILSASLLHLRRIADALHVADTAEISLYESINNTLAKGY
ncbi:MAG: DUF4011 domain-containing protein, partial [Muribaculaceae bacterium]|nr:DUF4011 domain-containing protein [Muribaculaceae bacterium]